MRVTWEIHRTKPRTDNDNKGLWTKEGTHRKVDDANLMAQILWRCVRNGNVRYDEYGIFHTCKSDAVPRGGGRHIHSYAFVSF
jgi:hypothetical protein